MGSEHVRGGRTRAEYLPVCILIVGAVLFATTVSADGPPAGVDPEEWVGIQQQIEVERHKIVESDRPGRLHQADNPTQRFTVHFGAEDVVIAPHGRDEPAWQLALRLTSWGAAHDLKQVDFATATAEGNRVEYRRGPLTEWYVNTTTGLEQGFTIEAPPVEGIDELMLEITVGGYLTAELAENGQNVTFRHENSNTLLTYSGLKAWDAVNEPLEARMELASGGTRLRIVVAVDGSAWPVTVDPILSHVAKLQPTPKLDTSSAEFGRSVAIDGEFMVVGMRDVVHGESSGSAHVFQRDKGGSNAWGHVTKIIASDGAVEDYFGESVAISGSTVVVGAYGDDDLGDYSGSAYVFERSHGGPDAWGQIAKLKPIDGTTDDRFGTSVTIDFDTIVIGACNDDDHGDRSGSAYVFERDQGGADAWGQIAKLTAFDGTEEDYFGYSVAINGDTAIVGSRGDGNGRGSAYVFRRDQGGPNAWDHISKLAADDAAAGAWFGWSVAISGDTVVVGARSDDDIAPNAGAAYVFQGDQGHPETWVQVGKITAADGEESDGFGYAASICADTAIIGAPYSDNTGLDSIGSAYVFQRNQGGPNAWGQVKKVTAADGEAGDRFGKSVSINGDTVIAGAPFVSDEFYASGSVYVFERDQGGADTWGQVAEQPSPPVFHARSFYFGWSAAFNGETAIVGAYGDNENGYLSGSAFVFKRNQSRLETWDVVAKIVPLDGTDRVEFGESVAIDADTAVVAARRTDITGNDSGSVYVFQRDLGGPDAWGQIAKITPIDGAEYDEFGKSVAIEGDTVIVGAWGDDDIGNNSGSAYVFERDHGGPNGWGQIVKISPLDGEQEQKFGCAVSLEGDLAVIGAYDDDENGPGSGAAYVFRRNEGGVNAWGQVAKLLADDGAQGDQLGLAVSISGDTAIVGAPYRDHVGVRSGSVYVFRRDTGDLNVWNQAATVTPNDNTASDYFGHSVALADDTMVVGATGDDDTGEGSGSTYVFRRSQRGIDTWTQVAKIAASDGGRGHGFGESVAIDNEMAIIGAPFDPSLGGSSGSAYVFRIGDILFADGFETGDTSGWSATVP